MKEEENMQMIDINQYGENSVYATRIWLNLAT